MSHTFDEAALLDDQAFLRRWREHRAPVSLRFMAKTTSVLFTLGFALDASYALWTTALICVVGAIGSVASLAMLRSAKLRRYAWIPFYVGIWVASAPNIALSGDMLSPQLTSYMVILLGVGVLIQSTFRVRTVAAFVAATYFGWTAFGIWRRGVDGVFTDGGLYISITLLATCALACFVALARSEQKLASAVADGNAKLIEARVRLAQTEQANAAKSSFLVNMSHELRTPLVAILGYTDLAANDDTTPAERRQFDDVIKRNGRLLETLIADLLEVARSDANSFAQRKTATDPRSLAADAIDAMALTALDKGLELATDIDASLPSTVDTDPSLVRQVLRNLLDNALKFTDQGKVTLRVACDQHSTLSFLVSDTGMGIGTDDHDKLFRPFTQLDDSLTRRHGGLGIGLMLSRERARRIGGDVELVHSQLGGGSAFQLVLPVRA